MLFFSIKRFLFAYYNDECIHFYVTKINELWIKKGLITMDLEICSR